MADTEESLQGKRSPSETTFSRMAPKERLLAIGIGIAALFGIIYAFRSNRSGGGSSDAGMISSDTSGLAPTSGFLTAGTLYVPTTAYDINDIYGTQTITNTTNANQTTSTQIAGEGAVIAPVATAVNNNSTDSVAAPVAQAVNNNSNQATAAASDASVNNNSAQSTAATAQSAVSNNSPAAQVQSNPAPAPAPAPKPLPAPAPAPKPKTYTVKKGDNLWDISKKYTGSGANYKQLYSKNRGVIGSNPNIIKPGQKLVIPW